MRALYKRVANNHSDDDSEEFIEYADFKLHPDNRTLITASGIESRLTEAEHKVLICLIGNAGKATSREKISEENVDELGIKAFLSKPIAMRKLAVTIRKVIHFANLQKPNIAVVLEKPDQSEKENLQNAFNQQSQLLQMMSNIIKLQHDVSKAIIENLRK